MSDVVELLYDPASGVDFASVRNQVHDASKEMTGNAVIRKVLDPLSHDPVGLVVVAANESTQKQVDDFFDVVKSIAGTSCPLQFTEGANISFLEKAFIKGTDNGDGTFSTDASSLPLTGDSPNLSEMIFNEFNLGGANGDIPGENPNMSLTQHRGYLNAMTKQSWIDWLEQVPKVWQDLVYGSSVVGTGDTDVNADSFMPARMGNNLIGGESFNAVDNPSHISDALLGGRIAGLQVACPQPKDAEVVATIISDAGPDFGAPLGANELSGFDRAFRPGRRKWDISGITTNIGINWSNAVAADPLDGTRDGLAYKAGGKWYTIQLTGKAFANLPTYGIGAFFDNATTSVDFSWKKALDGLRTPRILQPALNGAAVNVQPFTGGKGSLRVLSYNFLLGIPQGGRDSGPDIEGKPSTIVHMYPLQGSSGIRAQMSERIGSERSI